MPKLSVVIITRNEEQNILHCLESAAPVADEIVVVDSNSTDNTARICREFGCKVYEREFDGYGAQKQFAVDQATNDWVLSVDADEIVSTELKEELGQMFEVDSDKVTGLHGNSMSQPPSHSITQSPNHSITQSLSHSITQSPNHSITQSPNHSITQSPNHSVPMPAGYNIPFSLHFMGRLLRYSGVGNEVHLRLFDRTRGKFTLVPVHEGIEVQGAVGKTKGRIIHFSYRNISHHLEKINTYTSQAAEGYQKRGESFSKIWVALKFPISFISYYIVKRGFLDGYPGFMWSFLAAVYATLKVAKTIELTPKS
jgi:glycosyltransferase involved in cell wall biosynthesis